MPYEKVLNTQQMQAKLNTLSCWLPSKRTHSNRIHFFIDLFVIML